MVSASSHTARVLRWRSRMRSGLPANPSSTKSTRKSFAKSKLIMRSSPPPRRSSKPSSSVSIVATGSYLPEHILTNRDLEALVDTTDEWIRTRTGIRERRIAAENESTSDMATKAALAAMQQAEVSSRGDRSDHCRHGNPRHLVSGHCLLGPEAALAPSMPLALTFPPLVPAFSTRWKSLNNSFRRTCTTQCSSSAQIS